MQPCYCYGYGSTAAARLHMPTAQSAIGRAYVAVTQIKLAVWQRASHQTLVYCMGAPYADYLQIRPNALLTTNRLAKSSNAFATKQKK